MKIIAEKVGRGAVAPVAGASGRFAAWVPASGGAVMCYTHLPPASAVGAVVVCSPLFLEASENLRAELLLAEALVARGFAVQRFDYRGYGNSFGVPEKLTIETAEEDCVVAGEHLRARAGTDRIGVLGTRWGGLVAAGAASRLRARAVALWEATPDGRAFMDELTRIRSFYDLWQAERRPAGYHGQQLAAGHAMDLVAWRVHPPLAASTAGASVVGRLVRPLPVRVVHGRGRNRDAERLTGDLVARGCDVTHAVLADRVLWWAGVNRMLEPGHPPTALELEAAATAAWLAERVAA